MAEPGHVQQVLYIAVQALGLIPRALQQLSPIFQGDRFPQGQQAVDTAAH